MRLFACKGNLRGTRCKDFKRVDQLAPSYVVLASTTACKGHQIKDFIKIEKNFVFVKYGSRSTRFYDKKC